MIKGRKEAQRYMKENLDGGITLRGYFKNKKMVNSGKSCRESKKGSQEY